jgi:hypothetical protein
VLDPEVIIIPAVIGIPAFVAALRMVLRHKEKMATIHADTGRTFELEARLERIEQAVDTIAVEMERIGEGQRFVTKLLAERPTAPISEAQGVQRGLAATPH